MALIKCPECGKEISDKAPACINCGCPVSVMKTEPAKPAAAFSGEMFQEFFGGAGKQTAKQAVKQAVQTAPLKTVPAEKPDMKLLPGIVVQCLKKFSGMAGLAGFAALGGVVVGLLNGYLARDNAQIAALGLIGCYLLVYLAQVMEFLDARKFLRKNGYEDSIRNDGPSLENSINAFRLCNIAMMARYIKKLNPTAGGALETIIQQGKKRKRKENLGALPYAVILTAIYYALPLYEGMLPLPYYEAGLIACHAATLVAMGIYGYKKGMMLKLIPVVALLFAPIVFAYYYSGMWYHILICAAAALVGMLLGKKFRKNNA